MADLFDTLSENDIKGFVNHPVWVCIKQDIEERIAYLHTQLEDAPKEELLLTDHKTGEVTRVPCFREIQGMVKELRRWSGHVENLLFEKQNYKE